MAETEDLIFDSNGIYIPQTWSDELVDSTAITPQRLDHIEQGIKGTSESLKEFSDSLSQKIIAGEFFTEVPAGSGERYIDVDVNFPRPMESDAPVVLLTDRSLRSGYVGMVVGTKAALLEASSARFTARIYCTYPMDKAYPRAFNYLAVAL